MEHIYRHALKHNTFACACMCAMHMQCIDCFEQPKYVKGDTVIVVLFI